MHSKPKVSVVTVVRNDREGLLRTMASVTIQDYSNLEYIVVDGHSSDGTSDVLQENKEVFDQLIIEADEGIYHAMNKAVKIANGTWIVFMNAGDCFASQDALSKAMDCSSENVDAIYSDWVYQESGIRIEADKAKLNVRHQSIIYKKELHEVYGTYVVGSKVTISDYIFFLSIAKKNWAYCESPISMCDQGGVSANRSHFYQRIYSEGLFSKRTRIDVVFILLIYPIYSFLKRKIFRVR